MKKTLLALGLAVACHSSFALMQLGISTATSGTVIINDNGAGDGNAAAGSMTYSNANFGGWNITVVAGLSNAPNVNPFAIDLAMLASCTVAACVGNDLFAAVGDSGFTQAANQFTMTYSSTLSGGTTAQQWGYDTNIAFGPSVSPGFFATLGAFSAPGGFGSTVGGGPKSGTYTLVLLQRYTANGFGSVSADGVIKVPEPGTLALLGLALGAVGFAARRKKV